MFQIDDLEYSKDSENDIKKKDTKDSQNYDVINLNNNCIFNRYETTKHVHLLFLLPMIDNLKDININIFENILEISTNKIKNLEPEIDFLSDLHINSFKYYKKINLKFIIDLQKINIYFRKNILKIVVKK